MRYLLIININIPEHNFIIVSFTSQLFMELGKQVVRKIRSDLSKNSRAIEEDQGIKLEDSAKSNDPNPSSCC